MAIKIKELYFFAFILFFILVSGCTGSPKAELSIADTDISIGTLSEEERILNISVRVHNIGKVDAKNVAVTAEAGPVNADGGNVLIGSTNITNIPSSEDVVAGIVWDTKNTYTDNMVSVTVDPEGSIEEFDKKNNLVLFAYSVSKPEPDAFPEGHPKIAE